ncbi:MAG: chromosomal replication initiator protein DnaA [Bacilli bacterium]|nr:chromosomal replication initiator protein DnaA [Bacilli bacterium]
MVTNISEITSLWQKALVKINERLDDRNIFDTFFADTYIYEIRNDTIVVVVNSAVAVALFNNKYIDLITDVITDITESNFKLEFIQANDVAKKLESQSTSTNKQPVYFKDSILNPNLTFDSFVVGNFNREASQASLVIASNPGQMFNPLFIYSGSGLGKTHLLHAIGNYISKVSRPGSKVLYISANDFVEEYVKFAKGEKESESIKDYVCSFDVLLLDDIQFMADKVKTQEVFFTIFNKMHDAGKHIVITSDRQPNELKGIEDRLVTRFSQGLSVEIKAPDQDTCVEILRKKIDSNGMNLSIFDENVLYFFAEKFSSNVRELEGAFNRLIFYSIQMQSSSKITMDVAVEAVSNLIGAKGAITQLNESKIINVVADFYNLSPSQITGKIRTGQIALARHVAMYLIRINLDVPLKRIGDMFGGKDHTTVMNAIQKVEKGLKNDEGLKAAVEELTKRIKPQ